MAAPSEPRLQEAGGYQLRLPEPTLSRKTARPKKWRLLKSESQDEKKDGADLTQTEARRQVRLCPAAPGPSQASHCKSIVGAVSQGSRVARCWASLIGENWHPIGVLCSEPQPETAIWPRDFITPWAGQDL